MSMSGDIPFCAGCHSTNALATHTCWIGQRSFAQAPIQMYVIQRCPVCEGRCNVPTGFYSHMSVSSSGNLTEPCQTCNGKGILKVSAYTGSVEKIE